MSTREPWYRTVHRWGQTNLTEIDGRDYDREFWREHWRKTGTQGIIVNAGGIVAYYPSAIPLHYRAEHLGDRDLFGEIVSDARAEGLAVLARMDCNRATPEFRAEHPDWFVARADGSAVETQGRFVACVNSPYYKEHIPRILEEVIERYAPNGFTDNSWTGAGSSVICHCPHCTQKFRSDVGGELPREPDWDDPVYRAWVRWSYRCREENWDLFNEVTARAGGEDCLWLGMVNANPFGSHLNFADLREIGRRSKILMCDHQSRDSLNGFEQNVVNGALLHAISSPEAVIPQSMAHYVRGPQAFRRASMPPEETRTWMRCGFAGGISPWWHHVGSVQEDRRQFDTSTDLLRWHASVDAYLHDRTPAANVALVWSQANNDFYGRAQAHERCALPWRGMTAALTRARIPYDPVHADDLPDDPARFATLVFPDVAVLADHQVDRVLRYLDAGGSVVITGATASLDGDGAARGDWPFARLTGFAPTGATLGVGGTPSSSWEVHEGHSYLRIERDDPTGIVGGFANTDILPFGGSLHEYEAHGDEAARLSVLATLVPPFPIYPPEFAWMRTPATSTPALMAGTSDSGGRVVLLPSDVDRQYGRLRLPDHGDLLAAAVRWTAGTLPLEVDGPGYLACRLYRHAKGVVLHIVNLTGLNEWPGYVEEVCAVGPIEVTVRERASAGGTPADGGGRDDRAGERARSLVTGGAYETSSGEDGARSFVVPSLGAHEVVLLPT